MDEDQEQSLGMQYDVDAASLSFPKITRAGTVGSFEDSLSTLPDRTDGGTDDMSIEDIDEQLDASSQFEGIDEEPMLQAVVFVEDAYRYRAINHKVGLNDLRIYRHYTATWMRWLRYTVIFILHILAFFEYPTSLTLTADLQTQVERVVIPCWVTQIIELLLLLFLLADLILKVKLNGFCYFKKHKWDIVAMIILSVSLVDWTVSFSMGCHEFVRFRRILRPFFILQNSSLMKKIVNCLRMTLPEVISVLLLLALHLYIFTLFGMLLFPEYNLNTFNTSEFPVGNGSIPDSDLLPPEGNEYFKDLLDSLISLLVLLTTANNPDITLPAYSKNRFASLFFILYLFIGLYCLLNMLLAVIYNQFRGYFLSSMQSSLFRRRLGVRAAFEVLRSRKAVCVNMTGVNTRVKVGVGGHVITALVKRSLLPKHIKSILEENLLRKESKIFSASDFQKLFFCLDNDVVHKQKPPVRWFTNARLRIIQRIFIHKYFTYFGIFVAFINLIIITVQLGSKYNNSFTRSHSLLRVVNFSFIMFYCVEQILKFWAHGWRRYLYHNSNKFDALITLTLLIGEIYSAASYGVPYFPKSEEVTVHSSKSTMWNVIRFINILLMVRMFRIIPHIRSMSLVITVLIDLVKNMRSFAGIIIVIFYVFAIVGMELFHGVIKYDKSFDNVTFSCGTYEQLNYWANNFDDFFASLVVLWDVMVVNNWQVFLYVYREKTSPWSYLFFVAWWIVSVIIVLNLFTALIMENFIMKWDRRDLIAQTLNDVTVNIDEGLTVSIHLNNVHSMFRDLLQEPHDNDLLLELSKHEFLKFDT